MSYLHLHYSILFGVCQEGIWLIFYPLITGLFQPDSVNLKVSLFSGSVLLTVFIIPHLTHFVKRAFWISFENLGGFLLAVSNSTPSPWNWPISRFPLFYFFLAIRIFLSARSDYTCGTQWLWRGPVRLPSGQISIPIPKSSILSPQPYRYLGLAHPLGTIIV